MKELKGAAKERVVYLKEVLEVWKKRREEAMKELNAIEIEGWKVMKEIERLEQRLEG